MARRAGGRDSDGNQQHAPRRHGVRHARYILPLAFGLGWGFLALLILFTDPVEALFGPVNSGNPVFILAVYLPAIAGLRCVIGVGRSIPPDQFGDHL